MILDSVGYLGGFLIAVALAPQLIRAWKTKSTNDISILWTLVLLVGLLLYIFYAIINAILPLMVFASVESCMVLTLIGLKIRYER
jgi:MtN3 and saliva related transmembrane protein